MHINMKSVLSLTRWVSCPYDPLEPPANQTSVHMKDHATLTTVAVSGKIYFVSVGVYVRATAVAGLQDVAVLRMDWLVYQIPASAYR
jgi:hypothetical protein